MNFWFRRVFNVFAVAFAFAVAGCAASPEPVPKARAECVAETATLVDLKAARDAVKNHMAYQLGGGVSVEEAFAPLTAQAIAARTPAEHLRVIESFVFALADHHVGLSTNNRASPRLVPTGTSVWADYRDGQWVVTQVRPGSAARRGGLREGMLISGLDGRSPGALALPPHTAAYKAEAAGFAMRVALAGTHANDALVVAGTGSDRVEVRLALEERSDPALASLSFPLPDVALIRINNALGDTNLPAHFDRLMERARGARAILLDLRDTPSGGNSEIAKPVMNWFVKNESGYQAHRRGDRQWTERVSGRRDAFDGQLIVLIDHWTGSMGEGMAIGLRSAAGATLVGTPMAGLRGAVDSFPLPCLGGARLRLPVEQLFTTLGQPREFASPDVLVSERELAAAGDSDAILAAAVRAVHPPRAK